MTEFIAPGSDAWRQLITPSKVAAILGVSRWESPYRLWHRMKGLVDPEPPKDIFDIGHDFEPAAANRWLRKNPGWRLSPGEVQLLVDESRFGFPAAVTLDRRATRGRARRVVEFKALACSTPILTVAGWSTMGDLQAGDEVYAPDGQPTKVLSAHPIRLGRPCYRITFRDGQSVVADEDHLWHVQDYRSGRWSVVRTADLIPVKVRHQYRLRVQVPDPIHRPSADLPIDPWLLGLWLGDGSSAQPRISAGESDVSYICGRLDDLGVDYTVSRSAERAPEIYLRGLRELFVDLGLMGGWGKPQNPFWGRKFIPDVYMLASESQRRELLAGLMDSDGTVGSHQAAIGMVRRDLMVQVLQLARSLGYRATLRTHRGRLNGQDAGDVHWVKFSVREGVSPFDMPRKRDAWEAKDKHCVENLRVNAIVAVDSVPTVPTRCITVAHESSLYVVGEGFLPTHNTARKLEEWGDELTDECPEDYAAQVMAQMLFTGWTQRPGHLLVLTAWFDDHLYEVPFDGAVADWIVESCRRFWDSLANDEPPALDDTVATYECVRALHPDIDRGVEVQLDPKLACSLLDWDRDYQGAEKRVRGFKSQVLDAMGNAQYAKVGDLLVADRRPHGRGGVALTLARKNTDQLIEEHHDEYFHHTPKGTPA